jgi:hypothetical protein
MRQGTFRLIVVDAHQADTVRLFRFVDGYGHLAAFTRINPDADEKLKAAFPRPIADVRMFRRARAGEVSQINDTEKADARLRDIARARGFRSISMCRSKARKHQ